MNSGGCKTVEFMRDPAEEFNGMNCGSMIPPPYSLELTPLEKRSKNMILTNGLTHRT